MQVIFELAVSPEYSTKKKLYACWKHNSALCRTAGHNNSDAYITSIVPEFSTLLFIQCIVNGS